MSGSHRTFQWQGWGAMADALRCNSCGAVRFQPSHPALPTRRLPRAQPHRYAPHAVPTGCGTPLPLPVSRCKRTSSQRRCTAAQPPPLPLANPWHGPPAARPCPACCKPWLLCRRQRRLRLRLRRNRQQGLTHWQRSSSSSSSHGPRKTQRQTLTTQRPAASSSCTSGGGPPRAAGTSPPRRHRHRSPSRSERAA